MMINKSLSISCKSFLVLIVFLCSSHYMNGKTKLLSIKSSNCNNAYDAYEFKPLYKQTWLSDKVLEIHTIASANCIGVNEPRIEFLEPFLYLKFDEFRTTTYIDSKTHKKTISPDHLVNDCNCVFDITWKIEGLKKDSKYIIMLNGQISNDYNKHILDSLLSSYRIDDNVRYFHLYDAIDKKGLKQGLQTFKIDGGGTTFKFYKNGIKQN